jgi:hypothetical protein
VKKKKEKDRFFRGDAPFSIGDDQEDFKKKKEDERRRKSRDFFLFVDREAFCRKSISDSIQLPTFFLKENSTFI